MKKTSQNEVEKFKKSFVWYQPFNFPRLQVKSRFGLKDREMINPALMPRNLKGKTWLDIGCNTGKYCLEAKLRGAKKVVGIDIDPRWIKRARKCANILGVKGIEYKIHQAEKASQLGKFDYVSMFSVIHLKQVEDPFKILVEAKKTCKKQFVTEIFVRYFWRTMCKFPLKIFLRYPLPSIKGFQKILEKEVGFSHVEYAGKNKNNRTLFICTV